MPNVIFVTLVEYEWYGEYEQYLANVLGIHWIEGGAITVVEFDGDEAAFPIPNHLIVSLN